MNNDLVTVHDLARRDIYAFISVATTDPASREKHLDDVMTPAILNGALELIREDSEFHPASLGPGEINPAELKLRLPAQMEASIEAGYASVFGHCASKDCPPYETEYCGLKDIAFRSQQMADVAGFYNAFGLRISPQANERVDHVSLETEFMSVLITRQLHAVQGNLPLEAEHVCREAQRMFFKDHLAWWLPAFGRRLTKSGSGFYMMLGQLICAFVPAERAILGLQPVSQMPSAEDLPSEEMMCQGCDAASATRLSD